MTEFKLHKKVLKEACLKRDLQADSFKQVTYFVY